MDLSEESPPTAKTEAGYVIVGQRHTRLRRPLPPCCLLRGGQWFQLVRRGVDSMSSCLTAARELEDEYLSNQVGVPSQRYDLRAGKEVTYQIGGKRSRFG